MTKFIGRARWRPTVVTRPVRQRLRRVATAIGLFLLAPLVGEFLLGNLRIDQLVVLPLFALLYGAGALLIRETVQRTGRGWPAIVLLAAAYALIEEGPVDQLLWNPSYGGKDMLAGDAYLPALGTNVALVQAVLSLHTVWSISVPIAWPPGASWTPRWSSWSPVGPGPAAGVPRTGLAWRPAHS